MIKFSYSEERGVLVLIIIILLFCLAASLIGRNKQQAQELQRDTVVRYAEVRDGKVRVFVGHSSQDCKFIKSHIIAPKHWVEDDVYYISFCNECIDLTNGEPQIENY